MDSSCQFPVLEHSADIQIFHINLIKIGNKVVTDFVIVVLLNVGLLRKRASQLQSNPFSVVATFDLSCELFLVLLDCSIGSLELLLRVLKFDTVTQNDEVFNSEV